MKHEISSSFHSPTMMIKEQYKSLGQPLRTGNWREILLGENEELTNKQQLMTNGGEQICS